MIRQCHLVIGLSATFGSGSDHIRMQHFYIIMWVPNVSPSYFLGKNNGDYSNPFCFEVIIAYNL